MFISEDVIPITYTIAPYNVQDATYILYCNHVIFPAGTIHIAWVDIFCVQNTNLLVATYNGHYFILPDNGIFSYIFDMDNLKILHCEPINREADETERLRQVAGLCAKIRGEGWNSTMAYDLYKIPRYTISNMVKTATSYSFGVLHISKRGNVIVDLKQTMFENMGLSSGYEILVPGKKNITEISPNCFLASDLVPVAFFNEFGFLELAKYKSSVAFLLGIIDSSPSNLAGQKITIQKKQLA